MVHSLTKQVISCVSAKDTVITVGIDQLPEIFVCLHQCLHIFSRIPIMHIVVCQTMAEQQCPMQLRSPGNRVHLVVSSLVFLRSPHIAFGIDGIVEAPACWWSDSHPSPKDRTSLRHRHQRIPSPIRPAPDSNPLFVDIRLTTQPQSRFHLVAGLQFAQPEIGTFLKLCPRPPVPRLSTQTQR